VFICLGFRLECQLHLQLSLPLDVLHCRLVFVLIPKCSAHGIVVNHTRHFLGLCHLVSPQALTGILLGAQVRYGERHLHPRHGPRAPVAAIAIATVTATTAAGSTATAAIWMRHGSQLASRVRHEL
jgi:hypothetical protein